MNARIAYRRPTVAKSAIDTRNGDAPTKGMSTKTDTVANKISIHPSTATQDVRVKY